MVLQGGTAVVNVVANGAALASSISGAVTGTVSKLGRSLQSSGLAMTKFLTVPLAALGAVSTSMALDFETTFARINALAGDIGHTTEQAKSFVLDLAQATGTDPGGLAEAMYFAASAGLAAKDVFPVVRASAQAAATGFGDAAVTAKTLTTVLHDYAGTGLSAANAMNILTRAIKVGKAEPADFAENIGIVIPLASQLGVSFQDVAAAIAQATNAGVESSRAVTGLRFLLASLQNPTEESKKKFEDFGISIADVQRRIAEPGGLLVVLQDIAKTFDLTTVAGKEAWGTITGGARGAVVANTLVGNSAESARVLWKALGQSALDSADDFQKAFDLMKQTPQFKFQQALTALKETAIDLGLILIPILRRDVIPAIREVIDWFSNLSQHTKSLIVRIGLIAAAFGPLLVVFGSILRLGASVVGSIVKIGTALTATKVAATGAATAVEGVGVAAVEAGTGVAALGSAFTLGPLAAFAFVLGHVIISNRDFNNTVADTVDRLHEQTGALDEVRAAAAKDDAFFRSHLVVPDSHQLGASGEALAQYRHEMETLVRAQTISNQSTETWLKTTLKTNEITTKQAKQLAGLVGGLDALGGGLSKTDRAFIHNLLAVGDFSGALKVVQDRLDKLTKPWTVKVTTKADLAALDALDAKFRNLGFQKSGQGWIMSASVLVHTRPASPWPWEVIEDGLRSIGFEKGRGGGGGGGGDGHTAFFMKTIIEVHADFSKIKDRLQTLLPLIRDAAGQGAADQAHAYARELNQLEKHFDRLKQKALDFRDAIRGAFSDSADLIGVIGDKLSEFRDQQASFLQAQAAGTLEPGQVAPTAPDLSGLIAAQVAQAQQLAKLLKQLQSKGLNVANLSDLASQGAGAIPIATALLDNPELIQQLNQAQQDIADITQSTADKMTQAAFGDKLLAMSHSLDDLLQHLNHFLDGLHPEKINDKNREFVDALDHLIQAIENATGRMGGGGGGGGNAAPNVTVNVGPGTDAAGAGRAVRDALLQLQRRNVTTGL